jgi:hypothetical protein
VTKDKNHHSVRTGWVVYVATGVCGALVGCFLALMPYIGL